MVRIMDPPPSDRRRLLGRRWRAGMPRDWPGWPVAILAATGACAVLEAVGKPGEGKKKGTAEAVPLACREDRAAGRLAASRARTSHVHAAHAAHATHAAAAHRRSVVLRGFG